MGKREEKEENQGLIQTSALQTDKGQFLLF